MSALPVLFTCFRSCLYSVSFFLAKTSMVLPPGMALAASPSNPVNLPSLPLVWLWPSTSATWKQTCLLLRISSELLLLFCFLPFLFLLQNDAGSTLVYGAFFFVLYREGIQQIYLIAILAIAMIGILTLKFGITITMVSLVILTIVVNLYLRKRKPPVIPSIVLLLISFVLSFGISFFYTSVLKPHQQDRISLWLRLEKDPDKIEQMKQTILYNLNESEKAISSGGLTGKGFLEGTRTTGKFVPEQHTDYIFSTVGEEWGFVGSALVVVLFVLLIARIVVLAESQKSQFSRVYGYCVASIFFVHFLINVGMVMGLIPTVGIPLPFFSYGGSALWGFTILLFVFIKLDSNKINEW
jgi:rod shape determining protein RodA